MLKLNNRPWNINISWQVAFILPAVMLAFSMLLPSLFMKLVSCKVLLYSLFSVPNLLAFAAAFYVKQTLYKEEKLSDLLGIKKITLKDIKSVFFTWFLVMLIFIPAMVLWKVFLVYFNIPHSEQQPLVLLIKEASFIELGILLFLVSVTAPLTEEIFLRRFLYAGIEELAGMRTAIILTSIVFAIAHFYLLGLPGLLILGFAFQILYLLTNNLSNPILLHCFFNTTSLLATRFLEVQ